MLFLPQNCLHLCNLYLDLKNNTQMLSKNSVFGPSKYLVASRQVTSLSGMDDFGKKTRKPRGRKVADLHRGPFPHSLGKLAPPQPCLCPLILGQTRIPLSDCHGHGLISMSESPKLE